MDSIKVAHKAFAGFIRQPIDRKQLEDTKAGICHGYPNNYSSNASINAQLGSLGILWTTSRLSQSISEITPIRYQLSKTLKTHYVNTYTQNNMTIVIVSPTLDQDELQGILDENLTSTASATILASNQNPKDFP